MEQNEIKKKIAILVDDVLTSEGFIVTIGISPNEIDMRVRIKAYARPIFATYDEMHATTIPFFCINSSKMAVRVDNQGNVDCEVLWLKDVEIAHVFVDYFSPSQVKTLEASVESQMKKKMEIICDLLQHEIEQLVRYEMSSCKLA